MNIAAFILAFAGAIITFCSKTIAEFLISDKREVNEADIVYIKLAGFALILVAVIIVFIL